MIRSLFPVLRLSARRAPGIGWAALMAAGVMFGSSLTHGQSHAPPQPAADEAGSTPSERARRAQVVARFDGGTLTLGDVEDELDRQSPAIRRRFLADPPYQQEFVQRLVRFTLLAREAQRRGYHARPEVQHAVKQNAVQELLRDEFDAQLTPESLPLEQVQAYYEAQAHEFRRPAMVRASHIQVGDAATAQELLEKARGVDLRGFRRLAREHSQDEHTKLRGGDLRYFDAQGRAQGQASVDVPQSLVEAAFSLETVGELAPSPVRSDAGYSVLMLTGRRPAEIRSLEDAEMSIRLRLWRQQRQAAIDRFVASLRERIRPELRYELIQQIQLDPSQPGAKLAPGFPQAPPPSRAASQELVVPGDQGLGEQHEAVDQHE